MQEFYQDKFREKTPPYAIFQAVDGDTVITLYESGKAMFQGMSADIDASMWEEIKKGSNILEEFKELDDNYESKQEEKQEESLPLDINAIGSDEVGTGDYFGPIVVTASYVNRENIPFLVDLNVKDSKKLSDEQILKIVPKIIKVIPYKTIILSNREYNEKYSSNMNMNKIKAILHNRALYSLINENNFEYDYVVVDQFESEKAYFKHLESIENKVENITFMTKAEDKCLAVACSSLISRYIFIKEIDKMGQKYGMFIPKGANYYVEDVALKLIEKHGKNILYDIAKLNFSNTKRIGK